MKKKLVFMALCLIAATSFSSCHKDHAECGLAVTANLPTDDVPGEVRLWIYKADGALVSEYRYSTIRELGKQRYALPTGEYVLIAANNLVAPFSTDMLVANEAKPYENLLFALDEGSASPAHAHYVAQQVSVDAHAPKRIELKMNRILAELQFTIKGLTEEVERAEIQVMNAAKSFTPYSSRLLPEAEVVNLGSGTPQNGVIAFEMRRLMPVVALAENQNQNLNSTESLTLAKNQSRAEAEVKTLLQFTFYYKDGSTILCNATAPRLENGGTYTPVIDFTLLRPNIVVEINGINGWVEGETSEGEILNPNR